MKKIFAIGAAIAALGTATAPALTVHIGLYQVGDGGEFNVAGTPFGAGYVSNGNIGTIFTGSNGGFATFCIEKDEHINSNTAYAYTKTQIAWLGGNNTNSGDPICKATAWLYCEFATGHLAGYDYDGPAANRKASAAALQQAMWYLEGEGGPSNAYVTLALNAVTGLGEDPLSDNNAWIPTYVLNLYEGTANRQDLLVYCPVPDGGMTLIMLGAGLTGLALARRRLA